MIRHPHTAYLIHVTRESGERIVRCDHPEHTLVADMNSCAFDRMWEIMAANMVDGELRDGLTAEGVVATAIAEAKHAETVTQAIVRVHRHCGKPGVVCPSEVHETVPAKTQAQEDAEWLDMRVKEVGGKALVSCRMAWGDERYIAAMDVWEEM